MQVEALADAAAARAYYDARYADGYMDCWDDERQRRLRDVLRIIDLPERPRILDYGCGSGALTNLLAQCWPAATVLGVDVSSTGVASARQRTTDPRVQFAVLDESFVREHAGHFDLVWSHHVLEHVVDLDASVAEITALTAPGGRMLHALPCGNPDSFAHWLCRQRHDGIDPAHGNRFFFEEPSHLRRLRSAELSERFAARGVHVVAARFGCHRLGTIRLFTELAPSDLLRLLDPRPWHPAGWLRWLVLAAVLLGLFAARAPVQVLARAHRRWRQIVRFRTRRFYDPASLCLLALVLPALCLAPMSLLMEAAVRCADRREWHRSAGDPRGSEMFLEFVRAVAPPRPTAPPAPVPALAAGVTH